MNMRTLADDIKKRVKQREDMFLRRLMGMLAKMAKADGKMMIFCMGGRAACPHAAAPVGRADPIAPPVGSRVPHDRLSPFPNPNSPLSPNPLRRRNLSKRNPPFVSFERPFELP